MSVRSSVFVTQFEGESHGNELGVAVPHELCARRVAGAPEPPAEACDQTDGVAEALRGRQLARAGEGGEHAQLPIGEQQLARQFGHLAPEPDHQLDTPTHDHLDGDGTFEALGGVVLQLLDLAPGLEDAEVILDAPAQGIPAKDSLGVAVLVTGSVVSTNHSSASALGGARSSRACTTHSSTGAAPGHGSATGW